jgi:hypothetical protein
VASESHEGSLDEARAIHPAATPAATGRDHLPRESSTPAIDVTDITIIPMATSAADSAANAVSSTAR